MSIIIDGLIRGTTRFVHSVLYLHGAQSITKLCALQLFALYDAELHSFPYTPFLVDTTLIRSLGTSELYIAHAALALNLINRIDTCTLTSLLTFLNINVKCPLTESVSSVAPRAVVSVVRRLYCSDCRSTFANSRPLSAIFTSTSLGVWCNQSKLRFIVSSGTF